MQGIFLFLLLAIISAPSFAQDKIVLWLEGQPSMSSVGYLAAVAKGYYADAGLQVELKWKPTPQQIAQELQNNPQRNYAIIGSEILTFWDEGYSIISLGVLEQQSRHLLLCAPEITTLEQLQNKKIGFHQFIPLEISSLIKIYNVKIQSTPQSESIHSLLNHNISAIAAEAGIEPDQLFAVRSDLNVLLPSRFGVDLYGDAITTTFAEVQNNPQRAQAFLQATLQGWNFALQHLDASIALVLAQNVQANPIHLQAEYQAIQEVMLKNNVVLGTQNPEAWQKDYNQLQQTGLLRNTRNIKDHIYSIERLEHEQQEVVFHRTLNIALGSVLLSLLFLGVAWFFWRRLTQKHRALKESESRLNLALQSTSDALWEWNGVQRNIWLSPVGYALLGVEPAEALDWEKFLDCFPPSDQYILQSEIHRIRKLKGSFSLDLRLKNIGMRWVRCRGFASPDVRHPLITGILQDIHPLKTAELALRESEAQFREYFEMGLVGMAKISMDGSFLQVNRTCWELLGNEEMDVLGKNWKSFSHPADIGLAEELMGHVHRGDRQGFTLDSRMTTTQGKPLQMLLAFRAVRDGQGELSHWVMLLQDISQRRRGEQEKEVLLHQLSLKNRTLESMLQTIGHDFRNPLVSVMYHAGELAKTDANSPEFFASREEVQSGVQRLDRMLQGMLSLSRLGREIPELQVIHPIKIFHELKDAFGNKLQELHGNLQIQELPSCMGSETMLYEVWKQLLQNAIQYRDPQRPLELVISGKIVREWACYSLADNGLGIPSSSLGHIFSPFFRLERDAITEGDGLGLAYVTRILESHRGHIKVESELGKGSRFSVFLPFVQT